MNHLRIWLFMLCLICAACSGPDINEVVLQNLEDAKAKDYLREGGWLPMYLPSDSNRMRLRYDTDTNEVWLAFESNGGGSARLEQECKTVGASEVRLVRTQPRWWPESMSAHQKPLQLPSSHTYYKCSDGSFVALSPAAETSYYWFQPTPTSDAN